MHCNGLQESHGASALMLLPCLPILVYFVFSGRFVCFAIVACLFVRDNSSRTTWGDDRIRDTLSQSVVLDPGCLSHPASINTSRELGNVSDETFQVLTL